MMTLTNFWWLLIWLFAGGAILGNMPKRRELVNGKMEERWQPMAAFLMVLPYILWAGFRGDVGDTWNYRRSFINTDPDLLNIPKLFAGDTKDPGYSVLMILFKFLLSERIELFFLFVASFQMLSMTHVYRKYSTNFWVCIFLFVASGEYISWMMNGIRQFIAATMVFACFDWLVQKKYLPLVAVILLASTIHQSVLIMIPIIFVIQGEPWNLKTICMLALTLAIVLFTDKFLPILNDLVEDTQYDTAFSNAEDDGANPIRVMVYCVPAFLSLIGLSFVRQARDPVLKLCVNCSIVTMAVYLVSMVTTGIFIARLSIYTILPGSMAVPWLIDHIFERRSAKLVLCVMAGMYCLYFGYQTGLV